MINVPVFIDQYNLLIDKLSDINAIPRLRGNGLNFTGIEVDAKKVSYYTETYYGGSDSNVFILDVPWNEINEPIEFFEKKKH